MKFILLLALVGCAVNVQVTSAAAINTFYGTDNAEDRYATDNAAPLSINAAAANIAAAAPYPAADAPNASGPREKIELSDFAATRSRSGSKKRAGARRSLNYGGRGIHEIIHGFDEKDLAGSVSLTAKVAKLSPSDYTASKGGKKRRKLHYSASPYRRGGRRLYRRSRRGRIYGGGGGGFHGGYHQPRWTGPM